MDVSWTVKKAESRRIDAFELWCWGRLASPLDCEEIQPVHPKGNQLNVHWKDWHWSWNANTLATWFEELTNLKRPWCWERLKAGGEGMTEDKMVGWDHWLNGHEFEQALGVDDGQGSRLAAVHGVTKSQTWLHNWTELNLLAVQGSLNSLFEYQNSKVSILQH